MHPRHICIHMHTTVCLCIYLCIYLYIHIYIFIHINIYVYIHTYIYIYIYICRYVIHIYGAHRGVHVGDEDVEVGENFLEHIEAVQGLGFRHQGEGLRVEG